MIRQCQTVILHPLFLVMNSLFVRMEVFQHLIYQCMVYNTVLSPPNPPSSSIWSFPEYHEL